MSSIKERVKQGVITLDEAMAEIAKGSRGLKRSKAARWVRNQVKPKKKNKRVDPPIKVKEMTATATATDAKPLTLKEAMQARADFRPMPAMTPKAQTTLMGHMNKAIDLLKIKRKYSN